MSLLDINRITHYITIVNDAPLVPRICIELVAPDVALAKQVPIRASASNPAADTLLFNTGYTNSHHDTFGATADHPFGAPIHPSADLLGNPSPEELQLLMTAFPNDAAGVGDDGFFGPLPNNLYHGNVDPPLQLTAGFAAPFIPEHHLGERVLSQFQSPLLTFRSKHKFRKLRVDTRLAHKTLATIMSLCRLVFLRPLVRLLPLTLCSRATRSNLLIRR